MPAGVARKPEPHLSQPLVYSGQSHVCLLSSRYYIAHERFDTLLGTRACVCRFRCLLWIYEAKSLQAQPRGWECTCEELGWSAGACELAGGRRVGGCPCGPLLFGCGSGWGPSSLCPCCRTAQPCTLFNTGSSLQAEASTCASAAPSLK